MDPTAVGSALVFVLVVLLGAFWLLMRTRGLPGIRAVRPKGPAEVVQRLPLTAQHSLHLVRAGEEAFWVVTFPGGAVLHRADGFSGQLSAVMNQQEAISR